MAFVRLAVIGRLSSGRIGVDFEDGERTVVLGLHVHFLRAALNHHRHTTVYAGEKIEHIIAAHAYATV